MVPSIQKAAACVRAVVSGHGPSAVAYRFVLFAGRPRHYAPLPLPFEVANADQLVRNALAELAFAQRLRDCASVRFNADTAWALISNLRRVRVAAGLDDVSPEVLAYVRSIARIERTC